ncbi:pancreatic triacylglycerol lipase-like [Hyposmocoma kahamanoa]|uniref:pancreatic triacylglycerol lipase-like n=1 Tax=Hyposmocoma kahamanoa TaxID=1477025 RepID=UPI000E6D80A2|nr:pancreatic triacylglycerol lipase-like [Hyposmocoma kahamanoa]
MSTDASKMNIVSVNWAAGAEPPYAQAVANARLVALEIVHFMTQLDYKRSLNYSKTFHIIGHGLGAHIAGYIGKLMPIQRITALDPTGPYFANMPPLVRLHRDDADYVDVVHTHTQPYGQGYKDLIGHIDFYPNSGRFQPSCVDTYVKLTSLKRGDLQLGQTLSACSHKRSLKYYIEALIKPECEYIGVACPSFKDFVKCCGTELKRVFVTIAQ